MKSSNFRRPATAGPFSSLLESDYTLPKLLGRPTPAGDYPPPHHETGLEFLPALDPAHLATKLELRLTVEQINRGSTTSPKEPLLDAFAV